MSSDESLGRRMFLARIGVLGAAAGLAGPFGARTAAAAPNGTPEVLPDLILNLLRSILSSLSRDTFNGLAAFVVPGNDAYSRAQGTPRNEPGAITAKAPDFLMQAFDNFVPFPQEIARPVASALATATSDLNVPMLGPLTLLLPPQLRTLDDAFGALLGDDDAIPLSLAVAGLLNLAATQVNPLALNGLFLSPFARLSFAQKAAAFEVLEGDNADLVALLDTHFPEPLRDSVSGLLDFMSGGLLEFSALGAFCEFGVWNKATRTITGTPVGWQLTGYDARRDGNNDFRGYYQGRTEVIG